MKNMMNCRMCKKEFAGTLYENCIRIIVDQDTGFLRIICQQCEVDYLIPRFNQRGTSIEEPGIKIYQTHFLPFEIVPEHPDFMEDD